MNPSTKASEWINSVIGPHLGARRNCTWSAYLGQAQTNSLGGITYLLPCEGKVLETGEEFTLLKITLKRFLVIANALLDKPVNVGDKVALKFYGLKRFDGTAADGADDPAVGNVRSFALTGAQTLFPVKWPGRYLGINEKFKDDYTEIQNPYLRDMIKQLEDIPVNGGLRKLANILVDASATHLTFNDPTEEMSAEDAPAVNLVVKSAKFEGGLQIAYDRASDTYTISLKPSDSGQAPTVLENVHFCELGEVLIDRIDDGAWLLAKVTLLSVAPKKRTSVAANQAMAQAA